MTETEMIGEINALKSLLADTDYKAIKYAEGAIDEEEYTEIKALRQSWREKINEIEQNIEAQGATMQPLPTRTA